MLVAYFLVLHVHAQNSFHYFQHIRADRRVPIVRQIDFTDDATELYISNQYYRQTSLGPYSGLYAYPRPIAHRE